MILLVFDFLNFIDNTTQGEPTGRNWFIREPTVAGDPNSGKTIASANTQDANILFKKLGVYIGGVTVNRTGETIPGDFETYVFPSPIKVIPSSKPFQLVGSIKELADETIQLSYNGEFVEFTNKKSFFKVTVNDTEYDIESVSVNSSDATLIDIKLKDPIYQNDVILSLKMKRRILLLFSIILTWVLFYNCSDRFETPTIEKDSTIVYPPKSVNAIYPKITFSNKISIKTRKPLKAGTIFKLQKKTKVHATIDTVVLLSSSITLSKMLVELW